MPTTEKSYTAEVTVTEATTITPDPPRSGYSSDPAPTPRRETAEVAQVVLRADTLEQLKEKVAAHVALI